jgi:hypothetical protein
VQLSNFLSKLEENEKVIIDKNAKTFQMPCHIKQRLHIFNAFRKQVTDLFCLITFIVTKPSGLQVATSIKTKNSKMQVWQNTEER